MRIVVGLGNPGRRYEGTRHNVGFEVIDELARRWQAASPQLRFDAALTDIILDGEKVWLAAPQTFMNASGRAVRRLLDFFGLEPDRLLVVCDDLNLELGRLRMRRGGSSGGQKGLEDIIRNLGTQEFPRLRIGIGRPPPGWDPADYVLSRFRPSEKDRIEQAIVRAAEGVELWVREGIENAMNRINAPESE